MQPGAQINGYRLVTRLGDPSMGEVWKAQDSAGRVVAIKTISQEFADNAQFRARFSYEAQRQSQMRHPHIVHTLTFFERDDRFYLVMDYIPGGSLAHRLAAIPSRQMPVSDALAISQQILGALNFVHERMIIHRDVKPSNVLLNGDHAYLADFGIALQIGGRRLTTLRRSVGTAEYMSPEQILNPEKVNHLSDVYSFGCVLYEMLAGRPPFITSPNNSGAIYEVQAMHVKDPVIPIRRFNPVIPERLDRIVQVALSKNPNERFPGCGSFGQALLAIQKPSGVVPAPRPQPLQVPPAISQPVQPAPVSVPQGVAGIPVKQDIQQLACTPMTTKPARSPSAKSMLWTMLFSLAGLVFFPLGAVDPSWLAVAFIVQILSASITWLVVITRAWKAIDDGRSRLRPLSASLLMLVPLLNLFWVFLAVGGYPRDYNKYVERNGKQVPPLSTAPFMALCVCWIVALVIAWISTLARAQVIIAAAVLVQYLLVVPIMNGMMTAARNRLLRTVSSEPSRAVVAVQ